MLENKNTVPSLLYYNKCFGTRGGHLLSIMHKLEHVFISNNQIIVQMVYNAPQGVQIFTAQHICYRLLSYRCKLYSTSASNIRTRLLPYMR